MDSIWFNSEWEIKHTGGQPCEHLILLGDCDEGRSQPGVGWREPLLAGWSETSTLPRSPCQLPWERGALCCQVTIQKFMKLIQFMNFIQEYCRSFILKNPSFHSADHLCRLLLDFWLLGLIFLSCYVGTLERCKWDKRKGSVSLLCRQVVSALILPGLSPHIKQPFAITFFVLPLQMLYEKPIWIFQQPERHHSSWK